MLLKDFIDQLTEIYEESKGTRHFNGEVEVEFYVDDPNYEIEIEIDHKKIEVKPWMLLGCGCWTGANIYLKIKREVNDNIT